VGRRVGLSIEGSKVGERVGERVGDRVGLSLSNFLSSFPQGLHVLRLSEMKVMSTMLRKYNTKV
jgi:hypothetical protein